ncbi:MULTISPECIES: Uma2 family endonuclease [Nostoc]|uniref:Uma2 family endonuclease n=1 Tax=Nostoc paludosum FACHB-159 TaxID=2692908 RepID=A0ABR8KD07_9NOSO|nr:MULTISPECIES: Uma2 family endonuclease [Nostoc]MBD2680370.1 Uma2 family endonuclease [Nostoc sp. FACHB-857]MBD2736758.1 Uma2 family endonuclease [Nostoc paludosum FACHB-159]
MLVSKHNEIVSVPEIHSLEDFMANPPDGMEWVDGQLLEKTGMTLKHSEIQGNLYFYWRSYINSNQLGGKVYTEVPCRTYKQGRRPDVAYLTPDLVAQFGNVPTLPQSFPLIAKIVSPTDLAEELFLKGQEYLQSGCEEVWLVFPESQLVLVVTDNQVLGFKVGDVVRTQKVLLGFSVAVEELLT